MKIKHLVLATVAAMVVMSANAYAEVTTHVVKMLNKGEEGVMVFKPAVVFANVGDKVRFVPTTRGHQAQSFKDMTPKGGTPFKTKMNKETEVTIDAEGVWAYNCLPHKAMGMVGLIVVGENADLANFKVSKRLPPKARKRLEMYKAEPEKYSKAE